MAGRRRQAPAGQAETERRGYERCPVPETNHDLLVSLMNTEGAGVAGLCIVDWPLQRRCRIGLTQTRRATSSSGV